MNFDLFVVSLIQIMYTTNITSKNNISNLIYYNSLNFSKLDLSRTL